MEDIYSRSMEMDFLSKKIVNSKWLCVEEGLQLRIMIVISSQLLHLLVIALDKLRFH